MDNIGNNNGDPLKDLLLNADEVDRSRLAEGLKGVLGIDSESGRVVLKPGFQKLNSKRKVLAYILGCKVSLLLGLRKSEEIAAKGIKEATGLPTGTVNPKLKELKEERLVSQNDSSKYYIASHQIITGIEEINPREDSNE